MDGKDQYANSPPYYTPPGSTPYPPPGMQYPPPGTGSTPYPPQQYLPSGQTQYGYVQPSGQPAQPGYGNPPAPPHQQQQVVNSDKVALLLVHVLVGDGLNSRSFHAPISDQDLWSQFLNEFTVSASITPCGIEFQLLQTRTPKNIFPDSFGTSLNKNFHRMSPHIVCFWSHLE